MSNQGNVHNNNVTEAQIAVIKAVTPLILELTKEARQTLIIGNPNLQDNLRAGLALIPKSIVEKPTLTVVKQTMLGSTSVTTYGLGKRLTIAQMLRALMKLADDAPLNVIEKLAKERKHTLTPEQYEEVLEKQAKFFRKEKGGEDFGLRGDGWANLILVQDTDGSVSVADAFWVGSRWGRGRSSLGLGLVWPRESRLVVGNSDASNL